MPTTRKPLNSCRVSTNTLKASCPAKDIIGINSNIKNASSIANYIKYNATNPCRNMNKNNNSKSQINLSKSLTEDMDEHARVSSPISTCYLPLYKKFQETHVEPKDRQFIMEKSTANEGKYTIFDYKNPSMSPRAKSNSKQRKEIRRKSHSAMGNTKANVIYKMDTRNSNLSITNNNTTIKVMLSY